MYFDMNDVMDSEAAMSIDKRRVGPRLHPSTKAKYFDSVKAHEHPAGESPSSPRSVVSTLGSPRGTSRYRGISAGKLMASMKYDVGRDLGSAESRREARMSWPHQRGSVDSFGSMRQKSTVSPLVSPRSARDASPLGFLHDVPSDHIVWGTSTSSSWKPEAASRLSQAPYNAAASSPAIAINAANNPGPDGRAQQLSARGRDSPWSERGSRMFPVHLAAPRARSSSPELSRGAGKNARYPKDQSTKIIPKQVLPGQQGGKASHSAGSTASLNKAIKTKAELAKKTENGSDFSRSAARVATPSATSTSSGNKADAASRGILQTRSSPGAPQSRQAPSSTNDAAAVGSSRAARLQELRSKLEKSLKAAENGLHKDLEILDQRLGATRNKNSSPS